MSEQSVDKKEDEKSNRANKKNDWNGFKKDILKSLKTMIIVVIVGGLFLVHTGGYLFLSKENLKNLKKNDEDLFDAVLEVKSTEMGGTDVELAPYTIEGSIEDDEPQSGGGDDDDDDEEEGEGFFSLKKWAFPYKNPFNKDPSWKFNEDEPNFDTAKPVVWQFGTVLQKSFAGSYAIGRMAIETLRVFGYGEAKKSKKLDGKSLTPSLLFWGMGYLVSYILQQGIWLYALFSVMILGYIYFVLGAIEIYKVPDPPEEEEEEGEEGEGGAAGENSSSNKGLGGLPGGLAATAALGSTGKIPGGLNNPADALKGNIKGKIPTAPKVTNPVDAAAAATNAATGAPAQKGGESKQQDSLDNLIEKAPEVAGPAVVAQQLSNPYTAGAEAVWDAVKAVCAAIIYFGKRFLKIYVLFLYTMILTGSGGAFNGIWQPVSFIGWYLTPLFDQASRTIFFEYVNKQKWIIAILLYIIFVKAAVTNLGAWSPTYMYIAGVIILILALIGIIQ